MIRFFREVLEGLRCKHAWEDVETLTFLTSSDHGPQDLMTEKVYIERCAKCRRYREHRVAPNTPVNPH